MDKISFFDKLKICSFALFDGDTYLKKYCDNRKECKQREREMAKCVRPRTEVKLKGSCTHTDYFERP